MVTSNSRNSFLSSGDQKSKITFIGLESSITCWAPSKTLEQNLFFVCHFQVAAGIPWSLAISFRLQGQHLQKPSLLHLHITAFSVYQISLCFVFIRTLVIALRAHLDNLG